MQRILFVDDEQHVLDGLRNLLRGRRREWDLRFACGGEAAFAMLASETFDVVVSDMRMPRYDGAAVLARVRDLQPHAVRIVLSGQTEPQTAMKAVFVAHRFLAKPCDSIALQDTIQRACQLRALFDSPDVHQAVGRIATLPTIPATLMRLTRLFGNPATSMKDIAAVVERDIGLCAKILQLVNSAFFGPPRRVATIEEAVNYLGTDNIRNIALALEAFRGTSTEAAARPLQRHAMLSALLARTLFPADTARGDQAYLAALLHDVGRLLEDEIRAGGGDCVAIPHAALGAYLLRLWGLPDHITEAVAHHEQPMQLDHAGFGVVDAVHLASRLAAHALAGGDVEPPDSSYLDAIGAGQRAWADWTALANRMARDEQLAA